MCLEHLFSSLQLNYFLSVEGAPKCNRHWTVEPHLSKVIDQIGTANGSVPVLVLLWLSGCRYVRFEDLSDGVSQRLYDNNIRHLGFYLYCSKSEFQNQDIIRELSRKKNISIFFVFSKGFQLKEI